MSFVRGTWATLKRELLAYFCSPIAYVLGAAFLVVQGYAFWLLCQTLGSQQAPAGAVLAYFFGGGFLFWLFLLLLISVLTMRLFAEEEQTGTIEALLTAPVPAGSLVLGKYLAALGFYACLWVPTLAYPALLRAYAGEPGAIDPGPLVAGYLGTLLVGASALALGLLASAVARTQLVAAALSFVPLTGLILVGPLAEVYAQQPGLRAVLEHVNVFTHLSELGRGVVDSRRFAFHGALLAWALLAAAQVLRARRGDARAVLQATGRTLLAAAVLLGVNVLAARRPLRADWTRAHVYELSVRTRALLDTLAAEKKQVQVTAFGAALDDRSDLGRHLLELLRRAEAASSGALRVERVDPERDRARTRLLSEQFQLDTADALQGALIVSCEGRQRVLGRAELGEYAPPEPGAEPHLTEFRGEEALAGAILTVASGRTPLLCFTRGHGEAEHDNLSGSGLSDLAQHLKRQNFALRALTTPEELAEIPAACDAVVVVGPERPFLPGEAAALSRYLQRGGRLLALLGALLDRGLTRHLDTGLEELLLGVGIELQRAVVVDPPQRVGTSLSFLVEQTYTEHPLAVGMQDRRTVWPLTRPVRPVQGPAHEPGWQAHAAVTASDQSFAVTDPTALRTEPPPRPAPAPGTDAGLVPIAAAASATPAGARTEARVAVFGSTQIAWNDSLVLYNRDLLLGAAEWLTDAQARVGLPPKRLEQVRLVIAEDQQRRLFFIVVCSMPLMVLLLGLGVAWIRRR